MKMALLLFGMLLLCNLPVKGQNNRGYPVDFSSAQRVQEPQSPCPNIFQYKYVNNEWFGALTVPPPSTDASRRSSQPVKLTIYLGLTNYISSKNVGKLHLGEDKQSALRKVLQGDSSRGLILYRLQFPSSTNLPLIDTIKLNDKPICAGDPNTHNRVVTTVTLSHTFYPSANTLSAESDNDDRGNNNGFNGGQNINGGNFGNPFGFEHSEKPNRPHIKEDISPVPPVNNEEHKMRPIFQENEPVLRPQINQGHQTSPSSQTNQGTLFSGCGISKVISTPLIHHGDKPQKGSWPWLVALFLKTADFAGIRFICGGTLINKKYVITAAHCVNESESVPSRIFVSLGKFDLLSWAEASAQPRDVRAVHIHGDYRNNKYDADIALLQLGEEAVYNEYVQPACVLSFNKQYGVGTYSPHLASLIGKKGTVMGWGKDEHGNKVTKEPRFVQVPVVSQEECINSHQELRRITTNRTLCAGSRNGSGPCNGDSGGGLIFDLLDQNGDSRWFIGGIVSLSVPDNGNCDLKQFIVYTDVTKYGDWISRIIN